MSIPLGSSCLGETNTTASLCQTRLLEYVVLAAPEVTVIAALSAGRLVTFWKAPPAMMAGEIGIVALPLASEETCAVTRNDCSTPVDCLVSGLTENTPPIVKVSPWFRRTAAAAVQPSVTRFVVAAYGLSVAPVLMVPWLAPLTSGVPPSGPTVCDGTFCDMAMSRPAPVLTIPVLYWSARICWLLNSDETPATMVAFAPGSTAAMR